MMRHAIVVAGLGLVVASSSLGGQASASAVTAFGTSTTSATSATAAAAAPCSAYKAPGRVQTARGQSTASVRTARAILVDTVTCDRRDLARRATRDRTHLSFGMVTPTEAFALPDRDARYSKLARALTGTKPSYERATKSYIWPRVAGSQGYRDPAAWREAVRAGVITERESRVMQSQGIGYTGWRISVKSNGTWAQFIAGD